jgi:TolA-binding protein
MEETADFAGGRERASESTTSIRRPINRFVVLMVAAGLVVAMAAGGFSYYAAQSSSRISSLQDQLHTYYVDNGALRAEIAGNESHIATLESQLGTANSNVGSLVEGINDYSHQLALTQGRLDAATSKISSLEADVRHNLSQIALLRGDVAEKAAEIASLNQLVSEKVTQITSLQRQVSSLRGRVNELQSIVDLSEQTTIASRHIAQEAGEASLVTTFVADYAGYITISGTTTATEGYVQVLSSHTAYPANNQTYAFGPLETLNIPVLPGTTAVYFGNADDSGDVAAQLAVVYHY